MFFFSVLENNFLKIFLYLFLCKKFAPVPLGPHPTCTMGIIIWIILNLHALRTFNKIHCFYGVLDRRFVYTFLCKKKIDFLRCVSTLPLWIYITKNEFTLTLLNYSCFEQNCSLCSAIREKKTSDKNIEQILVWKAQLNLWHSWSKKQVGF